MPRDKKTTRSPVEPYARPEIKFNKGDLGLVFVQNLPEKEIIFVIPESALDKGELALIYRWIRSRLQLGFLATMDPAVMHEEDRYLVIVTQQVLRKFGFETFLNWPVEKVVPGKYNKWRRLDLEAGDIPHDIVGRIDFYTNREVGSE